MNDAKVHDALCSNSQLSRQCTKDKFLLIVLLRQNKTRKHLRQMLVANSIAHGLPSHRAFVAQLDRAPGFEPGGQGFESLRAHHFREQCSRISRYAPQVVGFWLFKAKPKKQLPITLCRNLIPQG